ncbi:trigger factor [Candidatus Saccharibacteria bacterium]|nr:trigger factor [Candidatus Saccharibacteria bacterium]
MQVISKFKTPTKVTLTITAAPDELELVKKHVLGHFRKRVSVPGFRPGKAPLNLIEKNIDRKVFLDDFIEHAINDIYKKALDHENIRPVSMPNVKLKKFVPFSNLEFDAEVETLGEIILGGYKQIKLTKPKVTVSTVEINEVVENIAKRSANRSKVDRPAKTGDEVIIDFSGKDKKGPVAGTDGKDYPLLIGSGNFIPGFEENIIGTQAGGTKEFDAIFPSDYGVESMRSREITFTVEVKKVNEVEKLKIDDLFATKIGPFKQLTDLKNDVKRQLMQEKQQKADREHESRLIEEITKQSKVQAPDSIVEQQLMEMEGEEKRNLVYRGQTWQEHLSAEGVSEQQHRDRQRPTAEDRVKAGLVLSEIAKTEHLKVTSEELEVRLQILKGQYQDPKMQAELDKPENRQDIEARLLTEKTISKLVDYNK